MPIRAIIRVFFAAMSLTFPLSSMAAESVIERRVHIEAGDVVLGASLYRPSTARGLLPAIVTAHGSAASTREGVGFYTHRALEMGFAVLSFDKRGVGETSGQHYPFDVESSDQVFNDLASDVAHAVRWFATQDGIDASRIGLFGGSQAGWIMPLAASKEPIVSFIVIGEGVPLSAGRENAHEKYLMARGGVDGDVSPVLIAAADAFIAAFDGVEGYDPEPVLLALDIPVLWIFGLRDAVIPVLPSIARLERLIRDGKANNDVVVLPFGDHSFNNLATGERYDLVDVIEPWLRKHAIID
ncbi:MAG: CocE/NonD family hydrolase [Pseudomonadota bacterium]